jgi:hypothetical protein
MVEIKNSLQTHLGFALFRVITAARRSFSCHAFSRAAPEM